MGYGVTFDPPLHWKEWESREDTVQEVVSGEHTTEVEDLESDLRAAIADNEDFVVAVKDLLLKIESKLSSLEEGEMPTKEELVELLADYANDLECML